MRKYMRNYLVKYRKTHPYKYDALKAKEYRRVHPPKKRGKGYMKKYSIKYLKNGKALKWVKKWSDKNKEKLKAHKSVARAIKKGKLIRKFCRICNSKKSEAHHPDYTKVLKVIWLCRQHHKELHKKLK